MVVVGIDIGSRTVKAVSIEDGRPRRWRQAYNSHDPISVSRQLLDGLPYDRLVATGYGRHLFARYHDCEVVTEIRAAALGTSFLVPECTAILDIGGQDTKAIALDLDGRVRKFEMNDKCAAGTGRFLEVMASALAYSMDDFITEAQRAPEAANVNSMCTVFAESEVVSLVARGTPREQLALGLHQSVARRSAAMLKRVPLGETVVFCGGVAHNPCIRTLIEKELDRKLTVPERPQMLVALGAALSSAGL